MSIVLQYRVLLGRDFKCECCDRLGTVESAFGGSFDWLCCPPCARDELRFSAGVSGAMLALRAAEVEYAADVTETLFSASRHVTASPWPDADAPREPLDALPDGFEDVEIDGCYLQWVPARAMNFGRCDRCFGSVAVLVGVKGDSVGEKICRACAVLTLEEAASLRLAIVEAEAPARVDVVRAEIDAAREEIGFVPVVVPPLTVDAHRRQMRLARLQDDDDPDDDDDQDEDEDDDDAGDDASAAALSEEPRTVPSDNRAKSTASGVQSKFFRGRRTRCGASKRNRYRG